VRTTIFAAMTPEGPTDYKMTEAFWRTYRPDWPAILGTVETQEIPALEDLLASVRLTKASVRMAKAAEAAQVSPGRPAQDFEGAKLSDLDHRPSLVDLVGSAAWDEAGIAYEKRRKALGAKVRRSAHKAKAADACGSHSGHWAAWGRQQVLASA